MFISCKGDKKINKKKHQQLWLGIKLFLDQWYWWPCAVVRSKPNKHPHRVSLYCNNVTALCSKWLQHNQSRAESGHYGCVQFFFRIRGQQEPLNSTEVHKGNKSQLSKVHIVKQSKLLSWQARQRDHNYQMLFKHSHNFLSSHFFCSK